MTNKIITTCAFGAREDVGKPGEKELIGKLFPDKMARFMEGFTTHAPDAGIVSWVNCLPPDSPEHIISPYAFKVYAVKEAAKHGNIVLWADSSVHAVKSLTPVWEHIKEHGYWFPDNMATKTQPRTCGEWTCDGVLPIFGITREEAFQIPQVTATCFGLDFSRPLVVAFMNEWERLERAGAFIGPWVNADREASRDPRVMGHRHDQTAASVVAYRLGMKTTPQPLFFGDSKTNPDIVCFDVER